MSTQEYMLVALSVLLPLAIAVVVTLWTLEQARLRNKKNRKRAPGEKAAPQEAVIIPQTPVSPPEGTPPSE